MSKIWTKLISVFIVIFFIVGFRSMIISDTTVSAVFRGLMSSLPFAEPFSDIVCKVLGYQNGQPLVSAAGFVEDAAKLMVMSFIQPTFTVICSLLFLRIPKGITDIYDKESYMDKFGYRLKEMLIKIITAPICAIIAGKLMALISDWAVTKFGTIGSVLFGLLTTFLAAGIAALPMILLGTTVSVALLWRLVVTMLGGMLTSVVTTMFSIAIYYAFINGLPSHIAGYVAGLIVALILLDIIITCFQRALGKYSAT